MLTEERVSEIHAQGLLAEVLGFETDEVALAARGATLAAYSGVRYLDFTGGIAVHACGHNHPEIVAAIAEQAGKVIHTSDIMRHTPQLELARFMADLLIKALPGSSWSFLFKNSGSESIDAAAKLALKATGRSKFVAFRGAFHGRTLFATALSCSKTLHWDAYEGFLEPLRANILRAPAPRCAGCDLKRADCCVSGLEQILEAHGNEIAAVYFEPVQGEGGYVPMTPAAAQRIRDLTQSKGILLIADEIQTGWGRTGRWFGFEHLGIAPDMVVFGKAIGGGLPLAGVAASEALMARWQPGEHGTTFGGNPIACAAGLTALRIIEREGLVERAALLGETIQTQLRPLIGQHGVTDVRGRGLMIGIELRDSDGRPDYARVDAVKRHARANGLLVLSCGAKIGDPAADNSTLRLIPSLNISLQELNKGLDIFISALESVSG
jgi:4-aminobutyrate aminotransferase